MMARAFLLIADSLGVGGAPDAAAYGDEGANTLAHIAEGRMALGRPLHVPNLVALGLGHACEMASGRFPAGLTPPARLRGAYGCASERSKGKDTPSGHWEIAGVPLDFDWHYFPDVVPCFPAPLTTALIERGRLPGILGNCHASGTAIIESLGEEHLRSKKPIIYTSADSVIQIAAHENAFGLERLYALCTLARELADPLGVCRVIARPFVGESPGTFKRTANRRDYAVPPPQPTLLDHLAEEGREVLSLGKIGDIFAHRGTGTIVKAPDNSSLFTATVEAVGALGEGGLAVVNFIDFDTLFGHRRNVEGYARALEDFDARLPELTAALREGDLAVITADHGCDPTWKGTDHTRERVPVLACGPATREQSLGVRSSFADIGQTLARHLGVGPLAHGAAWRV